MSAIDSGFHATMLKIALFGIIYNIKLKLGFYTLISLPPIKISEKLFLSGV